MTDIRPTSVPEPILPLWQNYRSRSLPSAGDFGGNCSSESSSHGPPVQPDPSHSVPNQSSPDAPPQSPGTSLRRNSDAEGNEPEFPDIRNSPISTFQQPFLSDNFAFKETLPYLIWVFLLDTVPRQLYLHCLFRLPGLYFSRFARIFETANLTLSELKEFALAVGMENRGHAAHLSPQHRQLQSAWERLLDDLVREWNTLNVVSALLIPAILTLFQIDGAAKDPIARFFAFWTLVCSLFSLLYGCSFISIFSFMRQGYIIAEVALETSRGQSMVWNFWVALAMPAIWLVWAIITFIICVMTFMWRSRPDTPSDLVLYVSPSTELLFRVFICVLLGTGLFVGIAIIITYQRRFSSRADRAWKMRLESFLQTFQEEHPDVSLYSPMATQLGLTTTFAPLPRAPQHQVRGTQGSSVQIPSPNVQSKSPSPSTVSGAPVPPPNQLGSVGNSPPATTEPQQQESSQNINGIQPLKSSFDPQHGEPLELRRDNFWIMPESQVPVDFETRPDIPCTGEGTLQAHGLQEPTSTYLPSQGGNMDLCLSASVELPPPSSSHFPPPVAQILPKPSRTAPPVKGNLVRRDQPQLWGQNRVPNMGIDWGAHSRTSTRHWRATSQLHPILSVRGDEEGHSMPDLRHRGSKVVPTPPALHTMASPSLTLVNHDPASSELRRWST